MRRIPVLVALLAIAAVLRPTPSLDSAAGTGEGGGGGGGAEGDVSGALALLGGSEPDAKSAITGAREFDSSYQHYGQTEGNLAQAKRAVGVGRPPLEGGGGGAGLVAIASALGLKDLTALTLYLWSDEAEDAGDEEGMELCLRAIPFVDPHFLDAYLLLGFMWQYDQPDKAEQILRQGLRWNSDAWELWFDLAWIELKHVASASHKDYSKVLEYTRGALSVQHPLFVRRFHAMVLQASGDPAGARDVYIKMLAQKDLPEVDRLDAQAGLDFVNRGVNRLEIWERHFAQQHPQFGDHRTTGGP